MGSCHSSNKDINKNELNKEFTNLYIISKKHQYYRSGIILFLSDNTSLKYYREYISDTNKKISDIDDAILESRRLLLTCIDMITYWNDLDKNQIYQDKDKKNNFVPIIIKKYILIQDAINKD